MIRHDLTYTDRRLKNIPHKLRLRSIFRVIDRAGVGDRKDLTYADFGCSNGFVTDLVARHIGPRKTVGFGHNREELDDGKARYPDIDFRFFELNEPADAGRFDLVTCFETLEHVGDLDIAIRNLIDATAPGGTLVLSAPIEVGPVGTFKFLLKTILYRYDLNELPGGAALYFRYLKTLLKNGDVTVFRDSRSGWGTHFGFDYRIIGRKLSAMGIKYKAFTRGTTRFFIAK
jgi:2-polyprenyl-3-methyl-5-hydroxy-6-metoxy-1,4-benzoquinol methylase